MKTFALRINYKLNVPVFRIKIHVFESMYQRIKWACIILFKMNFNVNKIQAHVKIVMYSNKEKGKQCQAGVNLFICLSFHQRKNIKEKKT